MSLFASTTLLASIIAAPPAGAPSPRPVQATIQGPAAGAAPVRVDLMAPAVASPAPLPASVSTLADAITLAYRTNPTLLASRANVRAADYRVPEARSVYGPTLTVQASHGYQHDRIDLSPGQSFQVGGWSTTANALLDIPIDTFGRARSAEDNARASVAYARDSLRLTETDTLLRVVGAYVSVRRDATLVRIAEENLALLQREYDDNSARFRVREITLTDLQQVETRLETGQAQLLAARGQLGTSRASFVQVIGAAPGELAPEGPLTIPFSSLDDVQAYAEKNGPLIRAAQSREKISRATIAQARAELNPRLDLQGSASTAATTPYVNSLRDNGTRGAVVFSWQIFDAGGRRARINEARASNDSDWRLADQAVRDTHAAVSGAWEQLASSRASISHYAAAVDAAQHAYDGAVLQERAGARTTLDVLNLARDLLDVRTAYAGSVADEFVARATLLQAAGQLDAPMLLALPSADPLAHLTKVEHHADIPIETAVVRAIDSIGFRHSDQDRPIRDEAARLVVPPQLPVLGATPVSSAASVSVTPAAPRS